MGKSHNDPLLSCNIFDQSSLCGLWSVWSLSEKWQTRGEDLYPDQESDNSKITYISYPTWFNFQMPIFSFCNFFQIIFSLELVLFRVGELESLESSRRRRVKGFVYICGSRSRFGCIFAGVKVKISIVASYKFRKFDKALFSPLKQFH